MKNLLLATTPLQIAPQGGFTGAVNGKGLLGAPGDGITLFAKFVSSAIGLLTVVAIIWFLFTFLMGAIGIISSGGDKNALESAKKKIASGVIGLVVIIAALFIISLLGLILGIQNILDPVIMFNAIIGQ